MLLVLIKGLLEDVRTGKIHVKQVFVLTHNVYFHREVTFNPKRTSEAMNEETFWVVRKLGPISKIVETYLQVFKKIFEKSDHSDYEMMMARIWPAWLGGTV